MMPNQFHVFRETEIVGCHNEVKPMNTLVSYHPIPTAQAFRPVRYFKWIEDHRIQILLWLILMTAALQALFASVPWVDIWVSSQFWQPVEGFAAAKSPVLKQFREFAYKIYILMAVFALFCVLAGIFRPAIFGVPRRVWTFILCLYAVGPALLVNGILKSYWGRARPADITEFGGDLLFSPPFEIAAQCQANCSFVSGEAAGAAAFAISAYLLTRFIRKSTLRWTVFGSALTVAVLGALLRTVFGRHFLSDVIFAVLLVSLMGILLSFLFSGQRGFRSKSS